MSVGCGTADQTSKFDLQSNKWRHNGAYREVYLHIITVLLYVFFRFSQSLDEIEKI